MSLAPRLNSLDSANAPNLSSLIIRCGEAVGIPTHPDRRRRWFRQSRKGGNYERRNNHVSISRVTNMITCWKSVSGSSEQGFLTLYPNPPRYLHHCQHTSTQYKRDKTGSCIQGAQNISHIFRCLNLSYPRKHRTNQSSCSLSKATLHSSQAALAALARPSPLVSPKPEPTSSSYRYVNGRDKLPYHPSLSSFQTVTPGRKKRLATN